MDNKYNSKYNIETEYKYLVDNIPNKYDKVVSISQYYFVKGCIKELLMNLFSLNEDEFDEITTSRLRFVKEADNDSYILTLKSKGAFSRKEYEKHLSSDLFNQIMNSIKNNITSIIIKNRYYLNINLDNEILCLEFDEYLNLKDKMYTCEVEINNNTKELDEKILKILNEKLNIKAINVTDDYRYKNSNLHKYF